MKKETPKKKSIKKQKLVKSMFRSEDIKPTKSSKSFDSDANKAHTKRLVDEVYKEGGMILIRSNKTDPDDGSSPSQIFLKEISLKNVYQLVVRALQGQKTPNNHESMHRKAFESAMSDQGVAIEDTSDGTPSARKMIVIEGLKQLKKFLEEMKRDSDEDEDDDD